MTIRQMSRLYSGIFNLYKTKYSGGEISRQTANNSVKNSTNWIKPKTNLESNFDDAMANLKKSAAEVKNLDFGEEKSVEKVENFLSDYNSAINFFAENNSVSSRFGRLQNNFSDATYFVKFRVRHTNYFAHLEINFSHAQQIFLRRNLNF